MLVHRNLAYLASGPDYPYALYDEDFLGTFAPFLRASERPMAIACLRLVTLPPLPPLPERSFPFFSRCNARSTLLPAALPYRAIFAPDSDDSEDYRLLPAFIGVLAREPPSGVSHKRRRRRQ